MTVATVQGSHIRTLTADITRFSTKDRYVVVLVINSINSYYEGCLVNERTGVTCDIGCTKHWYKEPCAVLTLCAYHFPESYYIPVDCNITTLNLLHIPQSWLPRGVQPHIQTPPINGIQSQLWHVQLQPSSAHLRFGNIRHIEPLASSGATSAP